MITVRQRAVLIMISNTIESTCRRRQVPLGVHRPMTAEEGLAYVRAPTRPEVTCDAATWSDPDEDEASKPGQTRGRPGAD